MPVNGAIKSRELAENTSTGRQANFVPIVQITASVAATAGLTTSVLVASPAMTCRRW